MSNTITIPKKLVKEVDKITRDFGISNEDFLLSAILYYLKGLKERANLKKELEMWEKISDRDLLKFEKM
ncbi:MAG: hypothetical protein KY055_00745 [Candidatus Nealsonbacteria bacterium]|nr:hypothetical protein [Candidatus Nealsonbacteria bacterium]